MKSELVDIGLTPCNDWRKMIQAQKHTAAITLKMVVFFMIPMEANGHVGQYTSSVNFTATHRIKTKIPRHT